MDLQESCPLRSLEARPLTGFPDAVDPAHIGTPKETMDDFAQCMRPFGQPEAGLSAVAQIGLRGAQRPAYTPTSTLTDGYPGKHVDLPQLSSQSRIPTVPQPRLRFSPSLPLSTRTEPSLIATNSRPDERPSGISAIATEFIATIASASELAIPPDERTDMSAPLRTQSSTPSSPPPAVAKTCDCFGPSGILVPSSSETQRHFPPSVDLGLSASAPTNSKQADDSPDHGGTRHMRLDPMLSVSFVDQSNFSHAMAVTAPKTLVNLPASESDTDSAIGAMDCGHTSPTTPCSCLALPPLDVRPHHDAPHNGLLTLDVPSGAAQCLLRPGMPDDPMTEDETPPSGRLPPSSLPASQVSELSLAADHVDILSVSNTEHPGSCDDPAMVGLGSIGTEDGVTDAQAPVTTDVLAPNTYGTTEGPCMTLGTSVDEDVASELPVSSPPSSSPPGLFSSPTRSVSSSSPSSSLGRPPCDAEHHLPTPMIQGDVRPGQGPPSKRARAADGSSGSAATSSPECRPPKRTKTELSPPVTLPNPTRPTQTSQAKQRKKLAAPFRSPVIKGPLVHGGLHAVYASGRTGAPATASKLPTEEDATHADAMVENLHVGNKDRTARAAKQFKPPMQVASAIASSQSSLAIAASAVSRVGAAPTIQALQGQIQTLKQAIKVKHSGNGDEDEVLEQLVDKWTAVGREVAWALWEHVKDLIPGTGAPPQGGWYADDEDGEAGLKRGFDPGWGYDDDEPAKKKARMDEDVEEKGAPVVQHTVGVMLRHLGIDPDTLGWNENEGDFVDVS